MPISSAGIGSGLDVESIITQMMALERKPIDKLELQAASIETKISAYGELQSIVSDFRDAALALTQPGTWSATTGSSADSNSVGVSTSDSAAPGSYAVEVQKLAAAQSAASGFFGSGTAYVGTGTLHIDLGSWNADQTAFTAQAGKTGVDIAITAADNLASVRDKINAANAGVSASILTDATGARLVLSSKTTGEANGFRISAVDGDGNNADAAGLSALAFDPASGIGNLTQTQAAANAQATINGLPVTSATNTLADTIQGVTLKLTKETTGPVQITVSEDTASIQTKIAAFVTAYNDLAKLLSSQTKYDDATKTAGLLQGEGTAVSLQRQLRSLLGSRGGESDMFSTLSDVGLEIQPDGTLKTNSTKLAKALENLSDAKSLFSAYDEDTASNNGIARRLRELGDSVLSTDGLLSARSAGLTTTLQRNEERQDQLEERLEASEARMRAQYTALDTKMATLSALSSYMTQQVEAWNNSKK